MNSSAARRHNATIPLFVFLTGMAPMPFVVTMLSIVHAAHAAQPLAVPTFHCMGLYWSPDGGTAEKKVLVRYRKTGVRAWKNGLPMKYNPIRGTTLDRADYRGSVVNLTPGTEYEFTLTLEGTSTATTVKKSTWSETFPEGATVDVAARGTPYDITSGGTAGAYAVYDGNNKTIQVNHAHQYCIKISSSYVIVRDFVLKGAGITAGAGSWPPIGAIEIANGVHDIVIEGCDISDWGRPHPKPLLSDHGYNRDSGIRFATSTDITIERVIIQRNRIHHPTYTSNNSYQQGGGTYTHPEGPQGITLWNNRGNHVIRYNEIYSDRDHMFNDIIGGSANGSYDGAPGPDCDIYCNFLSNNWDNAVELEGGGRNVRCWNNYMTQSTDVIGNAPVSIGPMYIWRNVIHEAEWTPGGNAGRFVKMGYAKDESWMTGHMYIFNNTCFQGNGGGVGSGIGGGNRIIKHCQGRNNIIHLRGSSGQAISTKNTDVGFDYDLYNGAVPAGSETHGVRGTPTYVSDAGFNAQKKTGNFRLSTASKGYDAGTVIDNFTDGYQGKKPDIGAHENGRPDFEYGVNAVFTPPYEQNPVWIPSHAPALVPGAGRNAKRDIFSPDGRRISGPVVSRDIVNYTGVYCTRVSGKGVIARGMSMFDTGSRPTCH